MTNGLLARALLAFLALPGVVAYGVPWLLAPDRRAHIDGFVVAAFGTLGLVWCVVEFYVAGRGTLAPWAPPPRLVTTGPYRLSRNPMYVSVVVAIVGWALAFRSGLLGGYAVAVGIAFHARVVLYEERWLARTHGAIWTDYAARVPRWFGRSRHRHLSG